jgi:argininosuccinate lyase
VALAESTNRSISQLTAQELQGLSDKLGDDVKEIFDFETSVQKRASIGGTSLEMIDRQVKVLREEVARGN